MMQKAFQRFVDILSGQPNRAELETALAEAGRAFGLPMFAYLVKPERRTVPGLISNYPTRWTDHYLTNRYDRLDPVIAAAARRSEPFEWGAELGRRSTMHARFFAEAADFGIRFGLTIPIRDRQKRLAAVTFASDRRDAIFRRNSEACRSALNLMALFFHRRASGALDPERRIAGIKLSPRQFECLEWAASGKSAWDTGQIIGISRRTVVFHLEAAKAKLEVRSKSQAIALFLSESLKGQRQARS